MSEQEQIENLKLALDMALNVIRSYQMDIRGSGEWLGVDLVEKGFCQGRIYLGAEAMIKRIVTGEFKP